MFQPWFDALLIAAGATLQIAGFVVLLVVIGDAARAVRHHADRSRDVSVYPDTARGHLRAFAPTVETGGPPTVEERVERLEARLVEHERDEEERRRILQDELSGRIESLVASVHGETRERLAGIQGLIETVADNPKERLAILLFALGLALMAFGSIDAIV